MSELLKAARNGLASHFTKAAAHHSAISSAHEEIAKSHQDALDAHKAMASFHGKAGKADKAADDPENAFHGASESFHKAMCAFHKAKGAHHNAVSKAHGKHADHLTDMAKTFGTEPDGDEEDDSKKVAKAANEGRTSLTKVLDDGLAKIAAATATFDSKVKEIMEKVIPTNVKAGGALVLRPGEKISTETRKADNPSGGMF